MQFHDQDFVAIDPALGAVQDLYFGTLDINFQDIYVGETVDRKPFIG